MAVGFEFTFGRRVLDVLALRHRPTHERVVENEVQERASMAIQQLTKQLLK